MKNSLVLGFILILLLTACSASKTLEKDLTSISASNSFFMGITVKNASNGETIIDFQGDKYFTPASNVKLFTLYAALKTLKDSVSSFEYLITGDSLIMRGAGDPAFLNDSLHVNSIKFLKNKNLKLYLLDKELDDEEYGAGWSWDDFQFAYMPERSLMPLFGNSIRVVKDKDSMYVRPTFFKDHVNVNEDVSVARALNTNNFYISNSITSIDKRIPFITSNQLVADLLSQELGSKVTLIPQTSKRKFIPFKEVLYDSLYSKMMKESDNFIAEQVLLQVGNETVQEYSTRKAIDYVLDSCLVGMPLRPRWVDGSGLSRYNLFSPQSMVFVLNELYKDIPTDKLMSYFPQGGIDGTLERDFKGQPYIRAKSGTLSNNYCLSGYLTSKKGNLLIFSYMNNHYLESSSDRKAEMAIFFKNLYENY